MGLSPALQLSQVPEHFEHARAEWNGAAGQWLVRRSGAVKTFALAGQHSRNALQAWNLRQESAAHRRDAAKHFLFLTGKRLSLARAQQHFRRNGHDANA